MGKVSLSIRLERATAAVCVVDSTAAVSGESHRLGRLNHEGGLRTIVAGAPDEFGNGTINSSTDVSVLCGLRSLELQGLVLCGQSSNLVVGQEVQNCTAVRICVVDDVTGGVLDSVLQSAGLGCHIVAHAVNGSLGGAAAVSDLVGKSVDAGLSVVAVLEDCGVNAVKALTQSAVNAVDARQNRIGSEGSGQVCLSSGSAAARISVAAALTAAVTAVTAEAIATPAKQQEDDDPNLLSIRLFILMFLCFLFA